MKSGSFVRLMQVTVLANVAILGRFSPADPPTSAKNERRYQQGPLSAEDFRGAPPRADANRGKGLDFSAFVETAIRWNFQYRFEKKRKKKNEVFDVEVTEVDVYSSIYPDDSFNLRKADLGLLDHEQGHFDIAEIYALEMKIKLREMIQRGEPLRAAGATEREGADKLHQEIQRFVERSKDDLTERQRQYDKKTNHGDDTEGQRLQRMEQRGRLKALQDRLKELETPKPK